MFLRTLIISATAIFLILPASAQVQQAGNEASANADATFQKLLDKCDNMEMLMLRARLRLEISRATEDAATRASAMLTDGFEKCAAGQVEAGKTALQEAYEIARMGVTEAYGQDATTKVVVTPKASDEVKTNGDNASKPWWKVW
ncbi:MAG: hypothetical protein ACO20X_11495 [Alphaproteobacteria bacterium]